MGYHRTVADTDRTRRLPLIAAAWLWAAGLATASATVAEAPLVIGHLPGEVVVDGQLDDWFAGLSLQISDPEAPPVQRNALSAGFGWQRERLCLAFRMLDSERMAAPPELDAYRFHLTDSLQWYLDTQGNSAERMDDDDLNFLLLPDGRAAVLRGDSLLGQLKQARVPQRQARALPFDYAARVDAAGWQGEICVPAAALGRTELASGQHLKADLAINDWLTAVSDPGAAAAGKDEWTRLLDAAVGDPPDPALRPWSWRNARDFGFPAQWRVLELRGAAPWWKRAEWRQAGLWVLLCALLALLAWSEWRVRRWRRQVRTLLQTWSAAPSAAQAPADTRVEHGQPPAAVADAAAIATVERRHAAFCQQVLDWVQAHLQEPLTPERLAQQFHMSLRTLQRRLREGLDSRPQDLILAARLDAAERLLRHSRLRVADVALQCGFDDPAYFARRFREHFGHAPSQHRDLAGLQ